jgi:glycosyltransferase involved in cell wall biosynthesis
MKISIITVCLNSENSIKYTLNSVAAQTYKNIEHIVVDGGSTDETVDIVKKSKTKLIIANGKGIYESLNIGINNSTGKWILILHSNDFLNDLGVIKLAVSKLKNDSYIYHGGVLFFPGEEFKNITRIYQSNYYKKKYLKFGLIPPHTGSFISKKTYQRVGLYDPSFKIAGDFDFFVRSISNFKTKTSYLDMIITRMQTGGVSGKNLKSYWTSTIEILKSLKKNKLPAHLIMVLARIPAKIKQFLFINNIKFNYKFKYKVINNSKETQNYFELIKNIKKFDTKKNFILSALNLAFLGSFVKGDIRHKKNFFCWPDGLFSLSFSESLKKIPGRDLLKYIKLDKKISRILVLGNLGDSGKKFLIKKFKLKIEHIILPFGNTNVILKSLKNLKINKNDLVFLTLPTPKQEKIAFKLSELFKNYKIICIGGSIAIASGTEKVVPNFLSNYEFIWRLRYETTRRISRLLSTFFYYVKGRYFSNTLKKINIDVI